MFFSYACKLAFYLLTFQSQQLVYQPHKNFDGTTIYKSETASYTTLTSTGDKPACLACYFSQLACSNQLLSGNPSCSVVNKFNCTLLKEQLQVEKQLKGEKYSVQFFSVIPASQYFTGQLSNHSSLSTSPARMLAR